MRTLMIAFLFLVGCSEMHLPTPRDAAAGDATSVVEADAAPAPDAGRDSGPPLCDGPVLALEEACGVLEATAYARADELGCELVATCRFPAPGVTGARIEGCLPRVASATSCSHIEVALQICGSACGDAS